MSTNRRDFLRTGAAAAAASLAAPRLLSAASSLERTSYIVAPRAEAYVEDLAAEALNAARDAGASWADVRVGRYRRAIREYAGAPHYWRCG